MKYYLITLAILTLNSTFAQHNHKHSKYLNKNEKQANSQKKFKATEDLKVRMEKILNSMNELNENKNDTKVLANYGNSITETVNDIFKNCHLEAEADAAIHQSLLLILKGASEFQNGEYNSGYSKIHKAFSKYEKNFIHEGWKHK